MSNRSQTQSLDRDISHRNTKACIPHNVQKVNNLAERMICYYHNQIENIFSTYSVKKFSDELAPECMADAIANLGTIFDLDNEELANISLEMKEKFSVDDLTLQYLDFVVASMTLLKNINLKLSQTILQGLLRYCVSLAKYCSTEISFVVCYEKIIQKNMPDIIREVKDIETYFISLKKVTPTARSVLCHCTVIVESVGQIRASINKLYYLVTEWVDEERCYPSNLSTELKLISSRIFEIHQRTELTNGSLARRQSKLTTVEKHLNVLRKNQVILKRKQRRIEYSRQQIDIKIKQIEDQTTCRDNEQITINKKLEDLKSKSNKNANKTLYRVAMEIQATVSEQRDLRAKLSRIDDNKLALERHRQRLYRVYHDISQKITANEQEILMNKRSRRKLMSGLQDDLDNQNMDLENLKKLHPILCDLNFLYSKKNSSETLRQLRNHGILTVESKESHLIDKMCEKVANNTPDSWRELYMNLPFHPARSKDQRSSDIEVIDVVSARNDSTPSKQARMSLNKWRLFYHNGTTQDLIDGLKKSHLNDIAKEIEELDAKSKHRYDDD